MFLSWKGALLYVTWGSLYGCLMKTYWKWRQIMQYWYHSSTQRRNGFSSCYLCIQDKKKKNQQNKNQQYNPPENYHWASKHIEMYGSKWQRRRSSLWFLLWCDVSCKEVHENETGQHSGIPLFSEVQGETESRKRQSAYLFGMWSKVKFKNTALLAKVKPKIKLTPQIWSICCQS